MMYYFIDPEMGQFKIGGENMLDARKLKGKIAERGLTQGELAKAIGISDNSMTNKMSGRRDFTIGEIDRICKVLQISDCVTKAQIFLA